MKYLILTLLLINTAYAAVDTTRKEIRKAILERAELNEYRTLAVNYCAGFTDPKDQGYCTTALDKILDSRISTVLHSVITDAVNKASNDLTAQIEEEKCVARYTEMLENAEQVIPAENDTCVELKQQWSDYQASIAPPESTPEP